MKLIRGIISIAAGYVVAIVYFTIGMLAHGESLRGDFWVVLFWVALYGFGTMLAIFLIPFLLSDGTGRFWNPFICVPVGAILGILALYALFPSMAMHYMYGGQAAIMSGVTFLLGSQLIKKPNKEVEAMGNNAAGSLRSTEP